MDAALVRELLREQHPDLAEQPLEAFSSGWDNEMFRLGEELTVRLPRREVAAELVENEQRCLPLLAEELPLPIPAPVRIGRPGCGYPWFWSVCRWIEGDNAARTPPTDEQQAASDLGAFAAAMHRPRSIEAPVNEVRGVPVRTRADAFEGRFAELRADLDLRAVRAAFEEGCDAPDADGPPLWLHGDLHPGNVLVRDGRIAAVIDFGDITAGDRASDLAAGWMFFGSEARERFRECAGRERPIDEATWARARAWAASLCLVFLAHSSDNALMRGIGEHLLYELNEEARPRG